MRFNRRLLSKIKLADHGDTIVEVMIAISIFALVLVISLTSTNRSLHSGTDATNRQQALNLAQQQVEFIKSALGTDLQTLQSYTTAPTAFCIDPTNAQVQDASAPNKPCNQFGGSQYDLAITHVAGADNTTVFKVNATWPSTASNSSDSLFVYYKVPQAGPKPPVVGSCSSTVTNNVAPGAVTLSGIIDPAGSSTSWHFAYGTTTALGTNVPVPDSVIAASAGPTPVSENITGLGAGTYYYTLVATNSDGTSNCGDNQFSINAPPPSPPTVSLTASPPSITAGSSSTLSWTSTNTTSCSAGSPAGWTNSTATSGSQSVSPAATTTYNITCTGPGGTTPASAIVTIAPPSSPPTVILISVTHNSSDDTYHVFGQVSPNSTPNTHPYISIGRTCDSGADSDNPGSGPNSGISRYENPLGPFSDSTTHDEHADMQDTQFSFFFCGFNNPYRFQQCAWWGTDINNWLPNHICSNEIDLSQGATGGTGGGGSGGNGLPVCFINVDTDGIETGYVVGADCEPHDNNGISFTYSATGFFEGLSTPGGAWLTVTGVGSSYTFPTAGGITWVNRSVTFTVSGCDANGCNSASNTTRTW